MMWMLRYGLDLEIYLRLDWHLIHIIALVQQTLLWHSVELTFQYAFTALVVVSMCKLEPPYEPPHEKTNNLHRRKQRRRSASR